MLRIGSVLLTAWGGNPYRYADGAFAAEPLAKGPSELGAAKVQLLRRHRVPRLNNEPAALNGNEVADGGKVWRHFAQEVTEGAHRSRESQLFFETEGACRLREEAGEPLRSPLSRALRAHAATALPRGPR